MRIILIAWLLLHIVAGCVNGSTIPEDQEQLLQRQINNLSALIEKFNTLYLTSLDQKLSGITTTLTQTEANVRNLQEKSGSWNIFQHHIQAWTDIMKAIDHKIDLVKLAQDETESLEGKLNSMEFTINHILTKIDAINEKSRTINSPVLEKIEEILKIMEGLEKAESVERKDFSAKLNAIMRHILNIENKHEHESRRIKVSRGTQPEAEYHNQNLDAIEHKIDRLIEEFSGVNDMEEVISNQKKNSELLKNMHELIQAIDERTVRLYDAEAQHSSKLLSCCRERHDDFSALQGGLLKRVDKLILDVEKQVKRLVEDERAKTDEADVTKAVDKECTDGKTDSRKSYPDYKNTTTTSTTGSKSKSAESAEDENIDDNEEKVENKPPQKKDENTDSAVDKTSSESDAEEDEEASETVKSGVIEATEKSGCHEIEDRVDGIYFFKNISTQDSSRNFNERYCAFPTDGVGWTVIQRRGPFEIQESFNRTWDEYKNGFGDLHRDFWFGNEFIHRMVYKDNHELRIEMEDFVGVQVWAQYSSFQLEPEKYNYKLMIGGFSGSVTDSMLYHDGMEFSTYDRRNDRTIDERYDCATGYGSGWWFDNCSEANLNGVYRAEPLDHNYIGIVWEKWHGDYSLKKTKMMIRPRNVWRDEEAEEEALFGEIPPEDP